MEKRIKGTLGLKYLTSFNLITNFENGNALKTSAYRTLNLTTTLLLAGVPLFSAFSPNGTKTFASGK
mgnify:CR=1 FL=1